MTLEYAIITQPDIASCITTEYQNMALQYDRILRQRQIPMNKSDMTWNWSFSTSCESPKKVSWFRLKRKSRTNETQASFTIQRYKRSQLLLKARTTMCTPRACDRLSNMMKSVSIPPKESREMPMPVRFKTIKTL